DNHDKTIHPGAQEICDGKDNNCNGQIDEGFNKTFYRDTDGDGYGGPSKITTCNPPAGYVAQGGDCNNHDKTIYPGAQEICDGKDNNCNGQIDEGFNKTFYKDADGDGYGGSTKLTTCNLPAGYIAQRGDCNDNDKSIHPGAQEICDGKDNNCNGQIDEGVKTNFYLDADGDGYGDPAMSIQACSAPAGFVTNYTDCDDTKASVHPGATEVCDGLDNNCNGQVDEGVIITTYYKDADGDGYGGSTKITTCNPPAGYVVQGGDCNDANAAIYPSAKDICNGLDDNCDGQIDEGCFNIPFIVVIPTSAYESQGVANVTVQLSKKSTQTVKVDYKTMDGTILEGSAKSQADYTAKTGTLSIPAGTQSGTISVGIAKDNITELIENFTVVLSSPVNASISVGTGVVAILDGTAPQSSTTLESTMTTELKPLVEEQKLSMKAMPNPTTHQFTLVTQSGSNQAIVIRVIDNYGRLVEMKNKVAANGTYTIGQNYRPGIYYVEALQGNKRTSVKLVKQ
ncbi:MAG: T9SS type A sorting domain-containing protein, partial [Chitinophagaceae bacterium]|nr:T9SS type A sorting domain-containing protein [Chitinophagaceae bacterium]